MASCASSLRGQQFALAILAVVGDGLGDQHDVPVALQIHERRETACEREYATCGSSVQVTSGSSSTTMAAPRKVMADTGDQVNRERRLPAIAVKGEAQRTVRKPSGVSSDHTSETVRLQASNCAQLTGAPPSTPCKRAPRQHSGRPAGSKARTPPPRYGPTFSPCPLPKFGYMEPLRGRTNRSYAVIDEISRQMFPEM